MATFVLNTPQDVAAPTTTIEVDGPLTAGTYLFQLIVIDDAGLESAPVTTTVTVRGAPVAKLTGPTTAVAAGKPFSLSGDGSTDPGGKITTYRFTLIKAG